MKPTLNQRRIDFIFVCLVVSSLLACKKQASNSMAGMPILYPEPKTVPYNDQGGYILNQFTGDTIRPIVNGVGDTIETGISAMIKGHVIRPDTENTEWVQMGKKFFPVDKVTKTVKRDKNGRPLPPEIAKSPTSGPLPIPTQYLFNTREKNAPQNLVKKIIDSNNFEQYTIGSDTGKLVKAPSGKMITTGHPFIIIGQVVPYSSPQLILSKTPRYRDNAKFDFQYLGKEEGMKTTECYKMIQDHKGYVWINHATGVTRFDGSSFLHFELKKGLEEFELTDLAEDPDGNLWFSLKDRIICYNGSTFTHFIFEGLENFIISMQVDKSGILWLSTVRGLLRFEPMDQNRKGKSTFFTEHEGLLESQVNCTYEDHQGNLWVGTPHFIFRFKPSSSGEGGLITYFPDKTKSLITGVSSILEDAQGNMWFGSHASGLYRYEHTANNRYGSLTEFNSGAGFSDDAVTGLLEDHEGNLWIGTANEEIYKYSQQIQGDVIQETFTHYGEENGIVGWWSLPGFEDEAGNIWISTATHGIYRFALNSFRLLQDEQKIIKNAGKIFEDSDHNFWAATAVGFVKFKNQQYQDVSNIDHYEFKNRDPYLDNNFIYTFFEDSYSNIWCGTEGALILLEPEKGKNGEATYFYQENGIHGVALNVLEDRQGSIWFGMLGALTRYDYSGDPKDGIITEYTAYSCGLPSNSCYDMILDHTGSIWVATPKGLIRFQPIGKQPEVEATYFSEREGLSTNSISTLCEDINGLIWIGTTEGLNIYRPGPENSPGDFIYYTEKEGLSSNNIQIIRQGPVTNGEAMVWVKNTNEIDLFKVKEGQDSPERIGTIGKQEGINLGLLNMINFDKDGRILIGASDGIIEHDNPSIEISSHAPTVQLHQIDINNSFIDFRNIPDSVNQAISFDSVSSFENYPVNLKLSYRNNHLKFHYTAIDWGAAEKMKYSYKMEGLDDTWSKPSPETQAEYRNLPSGKFNFVVCAIGESQKWSPPLSYSFSIRPPWWYSWWAFIFYSLIGSTMVYGTYRFQLNRKLELAEKKRLVELDLVKNRMYSNITHEFRTPLTLIHGPVSQALSSKTILDQKDIQSIYKQSERLQQLINQMLELQRLESGKLQPNYGYGEIIQFLRYLFGSFEPWAKEKNISLIISSSLQEVNMDFDDEKITQIISNLVSNAIKHTPRNGKVSLSMSLTPAEDFLLVNVQDSGVGIGEEDLPYIFDRFYQSNRAAAGGTGIGLALAKNLTELLGGSITVKSKVDLGSSFTLSLPITRKALKTISISPGSPLILPEFHDDEIQFNPTDQILPGKPIILIVEDHPEIAQYVASCLGPEYIVRIAINGNEGLQMAYEHIPDLIISDVMMPGKDGFEVTRILKTDIQTSHIPIILLTGRGDQDARLIGIDQGADAYLTKPFDPPELVLRVKKLLELRANLAQYYKNHLTAGESEPNNKVSIKENEFIKKLRLIIEEHINDMQFNMDKLSKIMMMSHSQLHRKITALTGESIGKFVRSIRLTKAKELLKNSDLTISEIAYETGFSEPGYFTKVFSKEYNMSPTDYRAHSI